MKWQPIESAPKDGRSMLLIAPQECSFQDDWRIVGAWMELEDNRGPEPRRRFGWSAWELQDQSLVNPIEIFPTHWMPLPKHPTKRDSS